MDRKRPVLGGSVRFPQYLGWSWTGCGPRLPVFGAKNRTEPDLRTLILTECRASGQITVWKLVRELLEKKGIPLPTLPTFGQILGCALASFRDRGGKLMNGNSRLYRIVVSESVYLIWKLRCEWRIERGEDQARLHAESEIVARWLHMINGRLRLDCLMASTRRYGQKAVNRDMVERTWRNVLHDERGLPDDWVLDSGVLVGMRAGRNR